MELKRITEEYKERKKYLLEFITEWQEEIKKTNQKIKEKTELMKEIDEVIRILQKEE